MQAFNIADLLANIAVNPVGKLQEMQNPALSLSVFLHGEPFHRSVLIPVVEAKGLNWESVYAGMKEQGITLELTVKIFPWLLEQIETSSIAYGHGPIEREHSLGIYRDRLLSLNYQTIPGGQVIAQLKPNDIDLIDEVLQRLADEFITSFVGDDPKYLKPPVSSVAKRRSSVQTDPRPVAPVVHQPLKPSVATPAPLAVASKPVDLQPVETQSAPLKRVALDPEFIGFINSDAPLPNPNDVRAVAKRIVASKPAQRQRPLSQVPLSAVTFDQKVAMSQCSLFD